MISTALNLPKAIRERDTRLDYFPQLYLHYDTLLEKILACGFNIIDNSCPENTKTRDHLFFQYLIDNDCENITKFIELFLK